MRKFTFSGVLYFLTFLTYLGLAQAYEVAEVVNGGTIIGTVVFQGEPLVTKWFEVEKDPTICGKKRALKKIAVRDGRVKGVVVVLEGVRKGKPFSSQSLQGDPPGEGVYHYDEGHELSLKVRVKNCNFGPLTGVLTPDQSVRFLNQDSMKHTLHSFVVMGRKGHILRTIHNRDLHPHTEVQRAFTSKDLNKSRIVRLTCNRHDFMQNWLYAVDTPYYSITDQDGQFTIDQVPPGHYSLVTWHPALGLKREEVLVTKDASVTLNMEFLALGP